MSKAEEASAQHTAEEHDHGAPHGKHLLYLAIGALGVVYGDIGTSPLYAFRESFHAEHGLPVTPSNVLGILSLIFWSLITVISIKYLIFVMRADNRGEGGILALTALTGLGRTIERRTPRYRLILLGLFGTALLYGDGMITPSISVLSAVEGLEIATPLFQPYIIPITIAILIALFLFQSQGTERVGKIFGPVTLLWFIVLALLGIRWIIRQPEVLTAINPWDGIQFFWTNGWAGFLVLGSVFLVVTGGEALYADMGHFGKAPIRMAWFAVVLPALLLNYFGQGALLLEQPEAVGNPFFRMTPDWALYPVVFLATLAAVIASQALITGAFSLTRQAVQLGYLPRVAIYHTSADEIGQIYIPVINWLLMFACIALVLAFGTSSNLAAAYGVAVTTTMAITTVLLFVIQREHWHWSFARSSAFTIFFLVIDLAFLGSNIVKIPDGGWFPLIVAAFIFTLMTTWKRGRMILRERLRDGSIPFTDLVKKVRTGKLAQVARVSGTAIFMSSDPSSTPPAMIHNLKHNKVIHEQVVLLSVETEEIPRVESTERLEVHKLDNGFYSVILHYGFLEMPNVPRDLVWARRQGLEYKSADVTYFLGRERLFASKKPGMPIWREHIFAWMSHNARNATDFFRLPPERVIELGSQVEL